MSSLQPPAPIRNALLAKRVSIQAALQESLEHAIILTGSMRPSTKSREVATLCHFFLNVPALQIVFSHLLKLRVTIKGVFGHHSRPYGPVVDFARPTNCELCDMLFLVTYVGTKQSEFFANASFFQAKLDRRSMFKGESGKRQRDLYENAKSFVFVNPELYASSLPEPPTHGERQMPGSATSGFCFWAYNELPGLPSGWHWPWHASTVTAPSDFDIAQRDEGFGEALFKLMIGQYGLPVSAPDPADFGWSRIVHDFLLRAARESLGYTYGVPHGPGIRRLNFGGDDVSALLRSGVSLVANPFGELFGWFRSEDLSSVGKAHAEERRFSADDLRKVLSEHHREGGDDGPGDNEPPEDDFEPGSDDSGGSGSFIHINISSE